VLTAEFQSHEPWPILVVHWIDGGGGDGGDNDDDDDDDDDDDPTIDCLIMCATILVNLSGKFVSLLHFRGSLCLA